VPTVVREVHSRFTVVRGNGVEPVPGPGAQTMSNLFQELKRRKVVRVAGVYAVVAWVLIQVADSVGPALQLPAWTTSLIVVLLLICFPIALMLAWAFELAPTGMQPQTSALSAPLTNSTIDRKFIYATFALVLLVAMFQIGERLFFSAPSPNANLAAELFYHSSRNRHRVGAGPSHDQTQKQSWRGYGAKLPQIINRRKAPPEPDYRAPRIQTSYPAHAQSRVSRDSGFRQ